MCNKPSGFAECTLAQYLDYRFDVASLKLVSALKSDEINFREKLYADDERSFVLNNCALAEYAR